MIINFSNSFETYTKENLQTLKTDKNFKKIMKNILLLEYLEFHMVIIKPSLAKKLLNICTDSIDEDLKKILLINYHKRGNKKNVYLDSFPYYIEISFNNSDTSTIKKYNVLQHPKFDRGKIFEIPFSNFVDIKPLIQIVNFISESPYDIEFYENIKKTVLKKLFPYYNVDYLREAAGISGKNIDKIYKKTLQNNELAITICDSDRSYPNDSLGSTAQGVIEVHDEFLTKSISEVIILNAREKENLIPHNKIKKYYNNNIICNETILFESLQYSNISMYLDYKKGTNLNEMTKDSESLLFYNPILSDKSSILNYSLGKVSSKKWINKFFYHIGKSSLQLYDELEVDIKSEWNYIGQSLIAWSLIKDSNYKNI